MAHSSFSRPVTLFRRLPGGQIEHVDLHTVREAFNTLNRGFEGYCLDCPEWHLAHYKSARALLDPTEQAVEAARHAVEQLSGVTRANVLSAVVARAKVWERRSLH